MEANNPLTFTAKSKHKFPPDVFRTVIFEVQRHNSCLRSQITGVFQIFDHLKTEYLNG